MERRTGSESLLRTGFQSRQEGFDPSLAWIFATLAADTDPAKAEAVIDEELARIRGEGVTTEELRKAKNIYLATFWRNLKTISGKAQALGSYECVSR